MAKVLIAGIGNVFLGDDGFGVEVATQLLARPQLAGVDVADFGIRGHDLAFALMDDYDAAILIDAVALGKEPGTLTLLEPDIDGLPAASPVNGHALNPATVLAQVRQQGGTLPKVLIVGCEPFDLGDGEEGRMSLSSVVAAAVGPAVEMVESVTARLCDREEKN